jgi:hypothetical protein
MFETDVEFRIRDEIQFSVLNPVSRIPHLVSDLVTKAFLFEMMDHSKRFRKNILYITLPQPMPM